MKRLLIIIVLAVSAAAQAQTPEDFFRRGNELFQAGDYEGAAEAYRAAVARGVESGELWFNLGNSQYKTGKIAQAILSYERAALFMPDDEDLRHNLRLANMLITDRIEPAPRLFVWDFWDDVRAAFSIVGITWLAYGFLLLTAAAAVSFLLARTYRRRKWSLAAGVASGALFLFALVVFLGKRADLTDRRDAILLADVATAKNSPDAASTDAFVLHAGVKVRILERVNGWDKVRLADGKVGWLEAGAAEPI